MIITKCYNEYCDIDGNRGITIYEAELEDCDADWIYEQIVEQYDPDTKYYTVINEDDEGREFEFEVSIKDWLSDEEIEDLYTEYVGEEDEA